MDALHFRPLIITSKQNDNKEKKEAEASHFPEQLVEKQVDVKIISVERERERSAKLSSCFRCGDSCVAGWLDKNESGMRAEPFANFASRRRCTRPGWMGVAFPRSSPRSFASLPAIASPASALFRGNDDGQRPQRV